MNASLNIDAAEKNVQSQILPVAGKMVEKVLLKIFVGLSIL